MTERFLRTNDGWDDPTSLRTQSLSGEKFAERDAKAYRRLIEIVRSSEAAAFVGAGVSMQAGLPSWTDLLDQLKSDATGRDGALASALGEVSDSLDTGQLLRAAYARIGPDAFKTVFGKIFHRAARELNRPGITGGSTL